MSEKELKSEIASPPPAYLGEEVGTDFKDHVRGRQFSLTGENEPIAEADANNLHRQLTGRHMQMIAIGVSARW